MDIGAFEDLRGKGALALLSVIALATAVAGNGPGPAAAVPRPEYPRPQFERDAWVNLNGEWTCEFDFGKSGDDPGREFSRSKGFSRKIVVPFCPESKLSGIGHKDFIPQIWYHRRLEIPAGWTGKRILLNFGAVDYGCEIYVDGRMAGFHFGGSASFSVDVTRFARPGTAHDLVVKAWDEARHGEQPSGKQSNRFKSYGCLYTRVTGIWQTVWLEAVAPQGLASCRIVPDFDGGRFVFTPRFVSDSDGRLEISVRDADGTLVGQARAAAASGVPVAVTLGKVRPWSPESPHLYGIVYRVTDATGAVVDEVRAYAGLRKFHVADGRLHLNNRPIFLSMVLDQGYYPEGAWTAPSDAALKRDIELSLAAGFNSARLHQKVFEERYHYWADRLGYLTWGEAPSWGVTPENPLGARNFLAEWAAVVERDANHPSIVVWTPLNETYFSVREDKLGFIRFHDDVYELTKRVDPTRPVNTASGGACHRTDIWSVHNYYRAGTAALKAIDVPAGQAWMDDFVRKRLEGVPLVVYGDQPYLVDEFGGLKWVGDKSRIAADNTWGYGGDLKSAEAVVDEIAAQAAAIRSVRRVQGFCYTQLTDVEQEQNGIYYYDRTPKFDMKRIRRIFSGQSGERTLDVGHGTEFPTLEAGFRRIAEIRRTDTASKLLVRIAPGDYVPEDRLTLDSRHGRTNWAELVIAPMDANRRPRIFGGVAVSDWKRVPFNGRSDVWSADVSKLRLPQDLRLAFFNGRRLQAARWPNVDPKRPYDTGFAFADSRGFPEKGDIPSPSGLYEDEIQIRPADRRRWAHPEDAWTIVHPRHNWWNRSWPVRSVSNDVVRVATAHREIRHRLFPWDRWCVENMAEELDAPGEWYFDPRARRIYLIPPDGGDPNRARVTLERGSEILRISASGVSVTGLEFTGGSAGVALADADRVQLLGCSIHDIGFHGGSGVSVHGHHVRVADCDIFNIGGNGVFVHGMEKESGVDDRMDVVVENNYVHHTGQVNSHGIGIWICGQGVRVSHNLIHDTPRCGIFGYGRFCEISYNRIRHTNLTNDDTGAIYGGDWITGTGTRVCYNWISDSLGFQRQRDGGYLRYKGACGIYPDEACGGLSVYGNLVENCHHVAMHLHNGRWITISNNVFVSNGALPVGGNTAQLSLQTWNDNPHGYFVRERRADIAREYHRLVDHDPRWLAFPEIAQAPDTPAAFSSNGTTLMGVRVVNNIVAYADQGQGMMLRADGLNLATNVFANNVYWPGQTTNVVMHTGRPGGDNWDTWRAAGMDANSVIADPGFRDAAKRDYRLRPDSPAFARGFRELPYSEIGLRLSPFRRALPKEAEGAREHPEWL